jgi:hypothetical protein
MNLKVEELPVEDTWKDIVRIHEPDRKTKTESRSNEARFAEFLSAITQSG